MTQKSCWAISDDKIGNQVQAQGLAQAVGFDWQPVIISLALPWRILPPVFWPPGVTGCQPPLPAGLPDLIISCGRQAVGPAVEIKRRAGARLAAVHIQHPRVPFDKFDLIAAPAHDQIEGPNILPTLGALGRINPAALAIVAKETAAKFAALPRPLIAVSIGGTNSVFSLDGVQMESIIRQIRSAVIDSGGSLLLTVSRRTGEENRRKLQDGLGDLPGEIWAGNADNPYSAYLANADYILVTGDSVNMLSEACATGKPVYIIALETRRDNKFLLFHRALQDRGLARIFDGQLTNWHYVPLDETARVASAIHQKISDING